VKGIYYLRRGARRIAVGEFSMKHENWLYRCGATGTTTYIAFCAERGSFIKRPREEGEKGSEKKLNTEGIELKERFRSA